MLAEMKRMQEAMLDLIDSLEYVDRHYQVGGGLTRHQRIAAAKRFLDASQPGAAAARHSETLKSSVGDDMLSELQGIRSTLERIAEHLIGR